jgi:hypothetical protein
MGQSSSRLIPIPPLTKRLKTKPPRPTKVEIEDKTLTNHTQASYLMASWQCPGRFSAMIGVDPCVFQVQPAPALLEMW